MWDGKFFLEMRGSWDWGYGEFLISLYTVGRGVLTQPHPYFTKISLYCLPLPLFQILSNPPLLSCHLQLRPSLFFLLSCFFGCMGDHATFDVLYILCIYIILLHIFYATSINFTEVWHIMLFFTGSLIWYHTHKHTQHTQGPVDRHKHINKYLHNLLCAHSTYST